jgi:hypothetical protein
VPNLLVFAVDLVAVLLLTFGIYYRRHRRRDMVLAFVGMNVAVMAVCAVLAGVTVGVGVGLGLFGVLAIVRLRSTELSQEEVAYYFASLALGLISGLQPNPQWLSPMLAGAILAVFFAIDQPRFLGAHRQQIVTVDAVYSSEADLKVRLEQLLAGPVDRMIVLRTDLVRDMTVVDVRYRVSGREHRLLNHEIAVEDRPEFSLSGGR